VELTSQFSKFCNNKKDASLDFLKGMEAPHDFNNMSDKEKDELEIVATFLKHHMADGAVPEEEIYLANPDHERTSESVIPPRLTPDEIKDRDHKNK
jgi:hypothetical protein